MAGQTAKRASRIFQDRASKFIKVQTGPKWKRELVPDHKFDFIDVDEFRQHSCYNYFRYLVLYILIIISTASYFADLWSAGILLIYNKWSLVQEPLVPFNYSKWIFVGCIALSFLLLAWDIYKARSVIASRDISLAVTNNMAYRYYSVRSYSRFCLFRKINDSRKTSDYFAFFVFYTLKGWKKLLFAQGPRQIIAGVTVYVLLKTLWTNKSGGFQFSDDWDAYGDWPQRIALVSMSFTCLIWIFSMIELITACILYIPVFMKIQGNLKEYCCHKIDKRISELLEKQRKKRIREQEKRMQKMKKNGKKDPESAASTKLAEPTVPAIEPFDMYDDTRPLRAAAAAPAYSDYAPSEYSRFAPMTPYSEPAVPTQPFSPAPPRRAYTDVSSYASDPYYHHTYASPAPPLPRQPYYEDPGSYFEMQQYHHSPISPNTQHYLPPSSTSSPRQQHAAHQQQYSPQPSPRQPHTSPAAPHYQAAAGPATLGNYF